MWNSVIAFADRWQTLIAGLLGVGALGAAKRQVKAAQAQTEAARDQTQRIREMERRRVAREAFAFHAMLGAAMGATLEDISRARDVLSKASNQYYSAVMQEALHCIKRAGFVELRPAFLHFGGTTLAEKFLRLDKEIDSLVQSDARFQGERWTLEHIDRIELLTTDLQGEAEFGIKQTGGVLADDIV